MGELPMKAGKRRPPANAVECGKDLGHAAGYTKVNFPRQRLANAASVLLYIKS